VTDSPVSPGLLRFGVFEADLRTGELRKAGRKVAIQEQPFRTLLALLERPGEIVTREELRAKVWPADTFVDFDTGLNKAVRKIREALGDSADSPRFVETLPRRGYRFLAPVEVVGTAAAPPVEAPPAETGTPHPWHRVVFAAAATAVLLSALGVWGWWARKDARLAIRSIAVLPLENLSGDPNQQYFADGMTDELITLLAQIHSLRVISRTSVMRFQGVRRPLPEIARELNVDAIIEGSVLQSGGNVRVTAQLLDARQDRHLWAASYERQLTDVVGLQGQVAQAIAEQVKASLTPQEHTSLARQRPVNPDAYQAFLRGRFFWNKRRRDAVEKAIGYFQQAIQLQPDYARAWAGLAGCYMSLGGDMGVVAPGDAAPSARAAVTKALEIDSDVADGHLTLANIRLFYDWDWAGAEREYRRALDLSPNDSPAHRNYSHYLLLMRRFDEALAQNKRAIELDPLDLLANAHLIWFYLGTRQPDKALAQSGRVLELEPGFTGIYGFVGGALEEQGKWPEAIAAFEKAKDDQDPGYLLGIAHAWAASGHRREAQSALAKLHELARTRYISPVGLADAYAGLGERDTALAWLEQGYRQHAPALTGLLLDSQLNALRADPRFQDLLRRLAFPPTP
jgi:TolB-like protein/DNA-binding winged helix-turn-helix (wHTH) protein/Flp pilus assembly protein TadD